MSLCLSLPDAIAMYGVYTFCLYVYTHSVCVCIYAPSAVNMEEFLDEVGSRLPTLRGIKFTSPDLHQLGRCVVHSNGKYSILYGCDQVLVEPLDLYLISLSLSLSLSLSRSSC